MSRLTHIALAGATCLGVVAAEFSISLPEISLPSLGLPTPSTAAAPTAADESAIYSPATSSSGDLLSQLGLTGLSLPTGNPNDNYKVLTVHTEKSGSALQLPTFAAATTSTEQAPVPNEAVATSSIFQAAALSVAADSIGSSPEQGTTSSATTAPPPTTTPLPPTTSLSINQSAGPTSQASHRITAYIAHTEQSASGLQVPTYSNAGSSNNGSPTQAPDSVTKPDSQAAGQTAQAVASVTSAPPILYASASGAVGLVEGSAPVVVGGTTYSLAAGGSALYINGVSTTMQNLPTGSWSTNGNGAQTVGMSDLSVAVSVKPALSTTSGLSTFLASSRTSGDASSTTQGATVSATGAATQQVAALSAMYLGLGTGVVGLLFL